MEISLLLYVGAGAGAGVLAGLFGVGGGIIMVPVRYFVFCGQGFAAHTVFQCATASSLAAVVFSGLSALVGHGRRHNIDRGRIGWLAGGAIVGGTTMAYVAARAPGGGWRVAFGLFLCVVAALVVRGRAERATADEQEPFSGRCLGIGVASGMVSAAFGVGGGVVAVPMMLAILPGVTLRRAVGNSTAVLVASAVSGTAVYLLQGRQWLGTSGASLGLVHLPAAIALAVTAIPFAQVGAWLAHRLPERALRLAFAALLVITGVRMALG
jgi:uncharacterized membrane protein YfcA